MLRSSLVEYECNSARVTLCILFADHVTQVCKSHNRVIVSFLQQVRGGTRPTTEGSRENIGHDVHV